MDGLKLFILSLLLLQPAVYGKVKLSRTVPVKMPQMDVASPLWVKDFDKALPKEVSKNEDANKVVARIGDRVIQNWLSTSEIKDSPLMKTANKVESAMKSEVSLGGGSRGIDHKVSFQVQALQSATKLEYKGWVNAAWNYDVRGKKSVVEVSEKIGRNKNLTVSHTATNNEDISAVGLRWNW